MEFSREKLEDYQKNLRSLREVTDEILSHMKGRDWSFRREITDGRGAFSQEKLCALVTELLDTWAEKVRGDTDVDPDTGESVAESWIRERRTLYGPYLYLAMRCTLEKGGYSDARGGRELKERTDFAFLLEQARRFCQAWCVLEGPDGSRENAPYWGFDECFGFHLYYALNDPDVCKGYVNTGNDYALTPDWSRPCDQSVSLLTNEGNTKRIHIQHSGSCYRRAETPEDPEEPAPEAKTEDPEALTLKAEEEEEPDLPDGVLDAFSGLDKDDDWYFPFPDAESYYEFRYSEYEQMEEKYSAEQGLTLLAIRFACPGEYCSACECFKKRFRAARPEVLRDFCTDLEEIVDLYLAARGIAPLTDTGKTQNVYRRIYDGPLQHAKRYGRGLQWETM